ncbi:unnamed protein product [Didymodactylos carnosus]|uniref:Uncharacterized protein n=1 Tax=Didymodactylos carnosus TaxID=1234261 RepID=A0A815FXZ2_9BILA|nr:unnamed protein product [Didymodactylos carnosus]CAF1331410.1 unnamed protein product [Didymodactylos carnosus]CAF3753817.1 unnamed protein product [Didymodactylos carnosus]CAF4185151.1 unnamed protein product [Didymodactylos carnosus]
MRVGERLRGAASLPSTKCYTSSKELYCNGTGVVFIIPDGCMDDGGIDSVGDSLEVYCVDHIARFCLSGEACPWRSPVLPYTPLSERQTCSPAGLTSDYMANASCSLWNNHTNYNCCTNGQIYF